MVKLLKLFLGVISKFFRWVFYRPPVLKFLNFLGHCIEAIADYIFWATDYPWRFVLALIFGATIQFIAAWVGA